jgi:hypothetical protein
MRVVPRPEPVPDAGARIVERAAPLLTSLDDIPPGSAEVTVTAPYPLRAIRLDHLVEGRLLDVLSDETNVWQCLVVHDDRVIAAIDVEFDGPDDFTILAVNEGIYGELFNAEVTRADRIRAEVVLGDEFGEAEFEVAAFVVPALDVSAVHFANPQNSQHVVVVLPNGADYLQDVAREFLTPDTLEERLLEGARAALEADEDREEPA